MSNIPKIAAGCVQSAESAAVGLFLLFIGVSGLLDMFGVSGLLDMFAPALPLPTLLPLGANDLGLAFAGAFCVPVSASSSKLKHRLKRHVYGVKRHTVP